MDRLKKLGFNTSLNYTELANDFDFHFEDVCLKDFFKLFVIDIRKIKYKLQGKEIPKYNDRGRKLGKI